MSACVFSIRNLWITILISKDDDNDDDDDGEHKNFSTANDWELVVSSEHAFASSFVRENDKANACP